ncbi:MULTISPECIES: hypothetical protein [Actinomadura]|jgi:uncharacterized protein (DUF2384 family)|uniref:Uncharacterized protein (DUF2384 family) n=1 Tax=Actinomadura coerulea TaxID=46159 RepID=A0A7X0L0P4_9ACTN|nr:hypothetical protein [Actinomadura coerulea]MBB6397399.1 uncharacterized protein (DUF2384 family) [Actinomadura coerulea]GGQ02384.1 hypothetical protein GCM10010187_17640 [Actinomadura coerulea]
MFPDKSSKVGQWVSALVLAVFVFQNPEKAAGFVTGFFDAVSRFANALG